MRIIIKDLDKKIVFEVELEDLMTVEALTQNLSAMLCIPESKLSLSFNHNFIVNTSATLCSFGIVSGSTVELRRKAGDSKSDESILEKAMSIFNPKTPELQKLRHRGGAYPKMTKTIFFQKSPQVKKPSNLRKDISSHIRSFSYTKPKLNDASDEWQAVGQKVTLTNGLLKCANLALSSDSQHQLSDDTKMKRLDWLLLETKKKFPDSFSTVEMLFIRGSVNRIPTEIFLDTGAQTTIISKQFAERANVHNDIDPRYKNVIYGMGKQLSLGRIWHLEVKIGDHSYIFSATVLDNFAHDLLLGLDMMKRYQCYLDLKFNRLICDCKGIAIDFLSDKEVADIRKDTINKKIEKVRNVIGVEKGEAFGLLKESCMDEQQVIECYLGRNK